MVLPILLISLCAFPAVFGDDDLLPIVTNVTRITCVDDPNCHESVSECFHFGVRGTDEECKKLGDMSYCTKTYKCEECTTNDRFRTEECPIMCGYCDLQTWVGWGFGKTCADDPNCYRSPAGCNHFGPQGTAEECHNLGDYATCRADGTRSYDCKSCSIHKESLSVATEDCPFMCGYCKPPVRVENSRTCADDDNCYESESGCFHYGLQGSVEECKTIGVTGNGKDEEFTCDSSVADYDCGSCNKWIVDIGNKRLSVRKYFCPVMCGYCRPA